MRALRPLVAGPAVALLAAALLGACGDDATDVGTGVSTTAVDVGDPAVPSTTSTPSPVAPAPTAPTAPTAPPGPAQIDVLVGTDDAADRVERVGLGEAVTISIINPTAADSYHVHGYDIEQSAPAGTTALINFTADVAGTFEVESHETGEVLFVLEVS